MPMPMPQLNDHKSKLMTTPNSGQRSRGPAGDGVDPEDWAGEACGLHIVYARPQMEAPAAAPADAPLRTAFAIGMAQAKTAGRKVLPTLMTPARQFQ